MPSPLVPSPMPAAGDRWIGNARTPAILLDTLPGPVDAEGLVWLDLRLEAGRIAAVTQPGTAPQGEGTTNLDGGQVWPCFVDAHTHLDKGHIWPRAPNPTGDFPGAIAAVMADRAAHWTPDDVRARFEFGLRCAHAHGTAAIRTHIDTHFPVADGSWAVFRELRDRWAGRIDLQACSIAPLDRFAGDEGERIADLVADSGGVLGMVTRLEGGVHDALPADFQPMLDRFFDLAEARDLALDLHVDESGDGGARALREIARTAVRRGFRRPIQVGHCCSLSRQPEDFARETIAACAEAGLSVVVLPMCNLYLQDRVAGRTPRWRGVTLVHELRDAGVRVSVASDNCGDPFFRYGDHDMLEVFRESARILHLDHPFGDWPAAAARHPAEAMGLPGRGRIAPGLPADLVLFRGRSMTELLSRPQSDRVVLRAGRVLDAALPDPRELDAVLGVPADR